jgi:hypothetical protein
MYNTVDNPIPNSQLFVTPTLEAIADQIEGLPEGQKANAYMIFMMTLNACHKLVEDEILSKDVFAC